MARKTSGGTRPSAAMRRRREWVLRLLLFLAGAALVWILALQAAADVLLLSFLGLAAWRLERGRLVVLVSSAFLCLVALEVGVRLTAGREFYRPHEKYGRSDSYAPGVDVRFSMPHGDLVPMDPARAAGLAEPREVRFRTDARGYRNDRDDDASQAAILCGDSLVTGNGTDQRDILGAVLRTTYGLDTYTWAYPIPPSRLLEGLASFVEESPRLPPRKVLFFAFEGNDFDATGRQLAIPGLYDRWKLRFARRVRPLFRTSHLLFRASRRMEGRLLGTDPGVVEVHRAGGHALGFYGPYVDNATAAELHFEARQVPGALGGALQAVFLVPTKYRVYHDLLDVPGRPVTSPSPALAELERVFGEGTPVIDLTPALVAEARRLLPEGRYVYWRDDTHWNGAGIRAVAPVVAAVLRGGPE